MPSSLVYVYVAFVIDAFARRIVGWRVSRTAHASFVLDALEQALHERQPTYRGGLVHHSDRGSQGGLNRSSQRFDGGGCDGHEEAAVGSMWAAAIAFTWSPTGVDAEGAPAVLDVHRKGDEQRSGCVQGRRVAACGDQMVPGGGRHATSDVQAHGK